MPKIPYKIEKTQDDEEDYEIVSFEDFCDKSTDAKNDLLTLNDNINYRLCYESDRFENASDKETRESQELKETSLNCPKKRPTNFAPFGRSQPKTSKANIFAGVIPKSKIDGDAASRDHRYEYINYIPIYSVIRKYNIIRVFYKSLYISFVNILFVSLIFK